MNQKVSLKEINRLAIPAIFAGIIEPIISLTDSAIAGKLPEFQDEAQGAVGLVGLFISALIWIFAQSSNAISSIISQAVGNKTVQEHRPLVSQLIAISFSIGIVLSITFFFLSETILGELYNAKGLLLDYSVAYFKIRVWGIPFSIVTLTLYGVFRGYQNTSWAMRVAFLGGFTNIGLDLLLVYGFDFNVVGIAYASLVAQILMCLFAVSIMIRNTPFKLSKFFPFHPKMKLILGMSANLAVRAIALNLAIQLSNYFATSYGTEYIAAHSVMLQIWLFSAFLLDGYANAGNALSGKLLGAKDFTKLRLLVADLTKIMIGIGIVLSAILFVFYYPIGRLFTKSENSLPIFYATFWMIALMQSLSGVTFLYDGIYKGMGKTIVLRNVFFMVSFFVFVPIIFLMDWFGLKLYGVWITFYVFMIARTLALMFNFRKNFKRV